MVIATISANDTFGVWQGKINQVIGVVDALTDGVLFVNGSLVFTNSTFSLALQSLNVANNLVLSNPSGNALFLLSSNIAANGTLFSTGSGVGLSVANNAFIGKNLTVSGVATLNTANANSISATTLFDNGNRVLTNLTITTANGIIDSGSFSGPTATINIGQILIDTVTSNVSNQAATGNAVSTVYNAALLKGIGGVINSANSPWSAQNLGKQLLLTSPGGNNNPALGFTDITGANLWAISSEAGTLQFSGMPDVNNTTNPSNTVLTLANSGATITNLIVSGLTTSITANITFGLSANTVNTQNEIMSSLGPNSNGQFRAVFNGTTGVANNAALLRNDGLNCYFLTTGTVVDPYHAPWNAERPFSFNMSTGAVSMDATGAGVAFGGNITLPVGSVITSAGLSLNQQSIVMPNAQWYWGKDTGATPHPMLGYSVDNHVFLWCGIAGLEIVNSTASAGLATMDNGGNFTLLSGNMSTNQNYVLPVNNRFLYGADTGGVQHPMIGYDNANIVTNYAGTNYWRILNFNGTVELVRVDNTGNMTLTGELVAPNIQINNALTVLGACVIEGTTTSAGLLNTGGGAQIGTYISAGGAPVNGVSGTIQAYNGYQTKNGIAGGFGGNIFNLFWTGSAVNIVVDNSLIASFQPGTSISDARLKENIKDAPTGALNDILQLRPVIFNFVDNELIQNDRERLGFIAHEVAEIIPQAVLGEKDAVDDDGKISPQILDDRTLLTKTIQALCELSQKYDALEQRLIALGG